MSRGLRLREVLDGWWSEDDDPDTGNLGQYHAAAEDGEAAGRRMVLDLTLQAADIEALSRDLATPITAEGTVAVGGLVEAPSPIRGGVVRLVVPDPDDPAASHMYYDLPLPDDDLHVQGFKLLTEGDVTELWGASTTLHTTVHRSGRDGPVVGRGVVRLGPTAFLRQLRSLDVPDHDGDLAELAALARFGTAFFGALWDDYGSVIHPTSLLRRDAPPRRHRPLDVPLREVHGYRADDGTDLRLTRYRGGDRGPVVLVHGMGANPGTYTLDTIEPNLLEFLVGHGFDVWLQEWRGSTALPTSRSQFDCDRVARHDHPAAEAAVREVTGRHDVHWVTHCVGSMTWMMSTLAGWTTPASLVLSQVGAHPVAPRISKIKAGVRAPNLLRALGVKLLTTDAYTDGSWGSRLLDRVLRLHPVPRAERCDSAVCRRLAFIYGTAVHHDALDEATHDALHELFGVTDLEMMSHLALCAREERLVAADGTDAYLPHLERADLPMTFISGAHNGVWLPESTDRDLAWLTDAHGSESFTRVVLDHHGHQDSLMGAEAHEVAYPAVLAHLERAGC
jgi:cholesterol oxidase